MTEKRPADSSRERTDRSRGERPDRVPKEPQLVVTLSGWRGPESAGAVMAEERGYFGDVGLNVSVLSPSLPVRPIRYVANRTDDLGVTHLPQVVIAQENGVPIEAVASVIPRPTMAMIWLEGSKISEIGDLRGKTIAFPGLPFQKGFLRSVLADAGLALDDVKVKNVGYELVPSLADGRADAIFGGSWNVEGVVLEERGLDPVITRVESLGAPPYEELVWIGRTDFVAEHPEVIRDFISALRRGTAAASEDPEGAVTAILESFEVNAELSRKEMEAGVTATLPLLSQSGYMSPRGASRLVDWMRGEGMIQRKVPVSTLLTNTYIP